MIVLTEGMDIEAGEAEFEMMQEVLRQLAEEEMEEMAENAEAELANQEYREWQESVA